jgi:hypothetical protein
MDVTIADVGAPTKPMNWVTASRVIALIWLVTISFTLVGLALIAMTNGASVPGSYGFPGFTSLFAFSFATVGAIVLVRRPRNVVGWVLLLAGLGAGFQTLYTEYAIVGIIAIPGSLPFAEIAAWLTAWAWLPFVFLAGPLLLSIFPDGRFVSRRWALAPVVAGIAGIVFMLMTAFEQGPLENFAVIDNPFGFAPRNLTNALAPPTALVMSLSIGSCAASLLDRYRRSTAESRQQLKWIAGAAVLVGLAAPLGFGAGSGIAKLGQVAFILALCSVPIATGIAVLRYRLYEIDTIINRALVYGLLTAVIAGLYTASIGLMQRLSKAVTGADSEATIVVTTIVIVVAFTPIKTRLQVLIDRRFKEARDPRIRLEAFTSALEERLWPLDERLVAQRFLDVAVDASESPGGLLRLGRGATSFTVRSGDAQGVAPSTLWSTSATSDGTSLSLTIGAAGRPLSERDRAAITAALAVVARELAVS